MFLRVLGDYLNVYAVTHTFLNHERKVYTMTAAWRLKSDRFITRDELETVIADCERRAKRSVNARQNLVVFRLATCCGLRASEIAGINLSDLLLETDKPRVRIRKVVGKGSHARTVPLWWDRATLECLRRWKAERAKQCASGSEPALCTQSQQSQGRRLHRNSVRSRFRSACRVLGEERLTHLSVHDGRHSFVSLSLAGGRSLAEVRDAAGHSTVATTNVYLHAVADDGAVGELFAPSSGSWRKREQRKLGRSGNE